MRGGVEQAEGGVRHDPGPVLGQIRINVPQYTDPGLDVAALRPTDLSLGRSGQVGQVPVVDTDQVRLTQGEVKVEVDQTVECSPGVGGAGDDVLAALEQPRADTHQEFDQQSLFAGEVPVDGRPADACRGADVLEADGKKSPLGDECLGGGQ